jgi:hypothetical protein
VKCPFVDLAAAVGYDTNDNLLPAHGTPHLGPCAGAKVGDVLEDAKMTINMRGIESGVKYARVHCLGKENFVLVVPISWVSDVG